MREICRGGIRPGECPDPDRRRAVSDGHVQRRLLRRSQAAPGATFPTAASPIFDFRKPSWKYPLSHLKAITV